LYLCLTLSWNTLKHSKNSLTNYNCSQTACVLYCITITQSWNIRFQQNSPSKNRA